MAPGRLSSSAPRFPGYDAYLRPRPADSACSESNKGGGLATLVREGLASLCEPEEELRKLLAEGDRATELQVLRIYPANSPRLTLVNVYSPPEHQHCLDLTRVPAGASVFTFGDFNRRHPDWDNRKPKPDRLGRELRDWAAERDLAILNDGSVTREQAGQASSPDVTLCPDAWREHCSWRVLDCHGSDHLPLQTDIRLASPPVRTYRRPRWSWKKARWDEFAAFTELAFARSSL